MTKKNIAIIGAYGGIGEAISNQLTAQDFDVTLIGRDAEKLSALANSLQANSVVADATDFEAIDNAIGNIENLHGIINCAGGLLLKPAHSTSQAEYEKVISSSLTTAFASVAAAGKHLKSNGGSVVLFSSAAAQTGLANHEAIAAAKAGVEGLMLAAAATYGSNNIRFNCIAPGLTATPMTKMITSNEMALKASENMHILGRIGSPKDIANMASFLVNEDNNWITGQVFGVDGGLAKIKPKVKI